MHKILNKEKLNSVIYRMEIQAEDVAANVLPGQFVVLRVDERGERVPLTVCDNDTTRGTITLVFQVAGLTTKKLSNLSEGDSIADILGPLGMPTEVKNFKKVICIGGGVGIAEILPIAKALKSAGNSVIAILGARTKELMILEDEVKKYTNKIYITTDDGTYGRKGFVTDVLGELLQEKPGLVYAVGPLPMMRKVAQVTKPLGVETKVSLNSNMIDATGMCGTCRVSVNGKRRFTCVHGPEFDAHAVDFDELAKRQERFLKEEKLSMDLHDKGGCGCAKS
ncbi:MAG: sulfide/dihydroorotate dehydrogenase-like FAD/NAD-binding protein [Candidatus Omnitrophota bacterium]